MAQRRKKGNTQMDAALDAMSPYGFPRTIVRRTVDQLLKVYGDEGWFFIEDCAYRTLIEKLLELPHETDDLTDDKLGDGPNEASTAGCSNIALVPCSNAQTSDDAPLTIQAADTISASSETGNQLAIKAVDTVPTTSEAGAKLLIKAVDIPSVTSEPGDQLSIKATDIVSEDNEYDCKPALSPLTKSSQPVGKICHKKRKPCHGWISDDSEEEDLMELPPAPMPKVLFYMQASK